MYQTMIRETLAKQGRIGTNPRHVEAWMRLEHDTLDAMSRAEFEREVNTAAECVAASGANESESLAMSMGIR